jgi:hypothetical protein
MAYKKEESGRGYGKRPLWQWVLLYVLIGGVIYYLVYYFFFRGAGGSPSYSLPSY